MYRSGAREPGHWEGLDNKYSTVAQHKLQIRITKEDALLLLLLLLSSSGGLLTGVFQKDQVQNSIIGGPQRASFVSSSTSGGTGSGSALWLLLRLLLWLWLGLELELGLWLWLSLGSVGSSGCCCCCWGGGVEAAGVRGAGSFCEAEAVRGEAAEVVGKTGVALEAASHEDFSLGCSTLEGTGAGGGQWVDFNTADEELDGLEVAFLSVDLSRGLSFSFSFSWSAIFFR